MYPKIDRPCPYTDRLASVMDGDFCRACKCTVFDLDAMAPGERRSFLKRTEGEDICVTYRIKPALAALALAASMGAAAPAMAQELSVRGGRGGRPTQTAGPVAAQQQNAKPNRVRAPGKPGGAAQAEEPIVVLAGRVAMPRSK